MSTSAQLALLVICLLSLSSQALLVKKNSAKQRQQEENAPRDAPGQRPLPKIFGVGLSLTGSDDLADALKSLGLRTLLRDPAFIPFLFPQDAAQSYDLAKYSEYDAVLDIPTALYYEQMMELYPESLFILSVRDENDWIRDMRGYMQRLHQHYHNAIPYRISAMLLRAYGSLADENAWLLSYRKHNQQVQERIPADRLAVIQIGDGREWAAVCEFLSRFGVHCTATDLHISATSDARIGPTVHQAHYFPEIFTAPWLSEVKYTLAYEPASTPESEGTITAKPWTPTKNAFVALLSLSSGPAEESAYFLGCLVALRAVRDTGSTADRVVMLLGPIDPAGMRIFQEEGIRVVSIPHFSSYLKVRSMTPSATAIYRAKMRMLQFAEYHRVIFIDTDMVLIESADYLFSQPYKLIAQPGWMSPLNAGLLLFTPSLQALNDVEDIANSFNYNRRSGWMEYGSINRNDGTEIDWGFYGVSVDQGLLYFYFACYYPANASRIDMSALPRHAHFVSSLKVDGAGSLNKYDERPEHLIEGVWVYLRMLAQLLMRHTRLVKAGEPILSRLSGVVDRNDRLLC
jgi:hypothetical protein